MEKQEQSSPALTFEEAIKELESIVGTLEAGDIALEDSLKLFRRGVSLTALCNEKLTEAQGVVKMLYRERTGELKELPFDEEEEERRG